MKPHRPGSSRRPRRCAAGVAACGLVLAAMSGAQESLPEPSAFGAHPRATGAAVQDAAALFDLWAEEQIAWHRHPGLTAAVVHEGHLLWAGAWGAADLEAGRPMQVETPMRAGSITKLFTATAILMLRDDGKLSLDDAVQQYLPWFQPRNPFEGSRPITLRQLLTHTSGLPREGDFPYWTTHVFPDLEQLAERLAGQELLDPPGARYRYSNLGLALLGAVVEAVSGTPWAEFVDTRILEPLGMRNSTAAPGADQIAALAAAYMRRALDGSRRRHEYYATGAIAPAASLVTTAVDLARFVAWQLGSLPPDARDPGLGRYSLEEMHRAQFVQGGWSGGRGLGFAVTPGEDGEQVSHGGWIGGHRAHLLLVPDRGLGVVVMTNAEDVSPAAFARQALAVFGAALDVQDGPRATPPAAWRDWLGTYTDPWGWEYEVMLRAGSLVVYEHEYPPTDRPLSALSALTPIDGEATTFRMEDGATLSFELDADGRVRRIRRRSEYLLPLATAAQGFREIAP